LSLSIDILPHNRDFRPEVRVFCRRHRGLAVRSSTDCRADWSSNHSLTRAGSMGIGQGKVFCAFSQDGSSKMSHIAKA
jgi:hypothetical protein